MKYVMVTSGKGGVGKTLCSINLAFELSKKGQKVALIDADISNPNAAELLGATQPIQISEQTFTPLMVNGIEFFSMATLSQDRPVAMQGSEYAQILKDVLQHTRWTAEIGIIDMPATITDTFFEILTTFGPELLGSIIVVQPAHVESARKMLQLHKSEGVPVLGVIGNMVYFVCTQHEEPVKYYIFGELNLEELCKEYGVEPLGEIPLSMDVRKGILEGKPFLSEGLNTPILNGVEKILVAKPVGQSFIERQKEKLKGIAREMIVEVMALAIEISNTEVAIPEIQKTYGYAGGRVIELDITDETLRELKVDPLYFRIDGGLLKLVKNPQKIDDEIRIWDKALVWCFLGRRPDTNVKWDLTDAWFSGKVKFYSSSGGTPRAWQFMQSVWGSLQTAKSYEKLKPILERIA